jgi:hypothetical protein
MAAVVEYPDDPMRTLPTSDPYVRCAEFGGLGLVTYEIDDAQRTVTLTDVTWTGSGQPELARAAPMRRSWVVAPPRANSFCLAARK